VSAIAKYLRFLVAFVLLWLLLWVPARATTTPERTALTTELLQERLESPVQSDGMEMIDLRQLAIDLTSENLEFRDRFYQQLQTRLNRSKQPLGLNFSESLIQGEFDASQLGLQTALSQASLPPLLTAAEQEQLQQDERFLEEPSEKTPSVTVFRGPLKVENTRFTGTVDFTNTFFLQRIEASGVTFIQEANWSNARFGRKVELTGATFGRDVDFSSTVFFANADFSQVQFRGIANFTGTTFHGEVKFSQADFAQVANLTRIQWRDKVDFSQVSWHDRALLNKSRFAESVLFSEATFEKSTTFRESQFQQPVLLRDASLLDQVDFSSIRLTPNAYLDVAGLTFDSDQAKIFGDTGQIGRALSVPILEGNEDVLRNLVRIFRQQEQIPDANQIEYTRERLRREQLRRRFMGNFLANLSPQDLLNRLFEWVKDFLNWVVLGLLLLLSRYGTSFGLVVGVGTFVIAYFGLLFWLVDRWRRRVPKPILPTYGETVYMTASFAALSFGGIVAIFRSSEQPWLTLLCLAGVLGPVPSVLLWRLYRRGRYHDLLNTTYFVEDGGPRQLRVLIGRLPVIPRFAFFRDRYMPILWDRHWSWLNYYDFSLNNLLKFGFNDIRLRDEHLPGIITTLVWYQWSLGILYIALLFWTLSRTIPGLNLLIYLK
jgi:uncharacterized protein YjbI with pentapeptide repeats